MEPIKIPDLEKLREYLSYDSKTGMFTWRKTKNNFSPAGTKAGCLKPVGYIYISFDKIRYLAHDLAWYLYYGEWRPDGSEMDHINRVRTDNRIANLRMVTRSENKINSGLWKHNTSGFKGVSFHKRVGLWRARIQINHRQIFLGYWETPEEAAEAYRQGVEMHFPNLKLEA